MTAIPLPDPGEPTALPLEGAAFPLLSLDLDEAIQKLRREIHVARYAVARNIIDDEGRERLEVLTPYYWTNAAAERARSELTKQFPNAAVVETRSRLDPWNPGHADACCAFIDSRQGIDEGLH